MGTGRHGCGGGYRQLRLPRGGVPLSAGSSGRRQLLTVSRAARLSVGDLGPRLLKIQSVCPSSGTKRGNRSQGIKHASCTILLRTVVCLLLSSVVACSAIAAPRAAQDHDPGRLRLIRVRLRLVVVVVVGGGAVGVSAIVVVAVAIGVFTAARRHGFLAVLCGRIAILNLG